MLSLFNKGQAVRVVSDQVGTPTAAHDLARVVWSLLDRSSEWGGGALHATNAGVASWYDLAVAVGEVGVEVGLLSDAPIVEPIATDGYPTAAARPPYSVLETSGTWQLVGYRLPHWRSALQVVLENIWSADNA